MTVDRLGKLATERDNRYAIIRRARRRFKACRTEIFLQGYSMTSAMVLDQKQPTNTEDTLAELLTFPLMEAIIGRRSRRFCLGAEIPDGVFAFKSKHAPVPLNELEQMLLLSTMGGVTGWHFAIMRHKKYAPYLSNYCNSPAGRTFPSAAGFITSEIFYTDDNGTYFFPTRDFHPPQHIVDGKVDLEEFMAAHKTRIRKISDKRLYIP